MTLKIRGKLMALSKMRMDYDWPEELAEVSS